MTVPAAIRWEDSRLWLLDQRKLPETVVYEEQTSAEMVAASIASMKVRGAPAIGIAAAYGMALAVRAGGDLARAARVLVAARPTAINLAWAVNRVLQAHDAGVRFRVLVDETRPLLQGARLTAWELLQAGLDVTLICDSMVSHLMSEGMVDLVIVGADRVTANGDVVNKIGTRGIAIASRYHGIPFHVAFPSSTFDADSASGADVDIEQRDAGEVTGPIRAAPGVHVRNPAFDVTPAELVTSWTTRAADRRRCRA